MEKTYSPFTLRVIEVVKHIPPGEIMSYGDVAKLAGSPGGARQVVRILHTLSSKYDLPWFRVVNKTRTISLSHSAGELQKSLLEAEGVYLQVRK